MFEARSEAGDAGLVEVRQGEDATAAGDGGGIGAGRLPRCDFEDFQGVVVVFDAFAGEDVDDVCVHDDGLESGSEVGGFCGEEVEGVIVYGKDFGEAGAEIDAA